MSYDEVLRLEASLLKDKFNNSDCLWEVTCYLFRFFLSVLISDDHLIH